MPVVGTLSSVFKIAIITQRSVALCTLAHDLPQQERIPQAQKPPRFEDPSCPFKGMYRLFDLITEQGSSGLGTHFLFNHRFSYTHRDIIRSRQDRHFSGVSSSVHKCALSWRLFVYHEGQLQDPG